MKDKDTISKGPKRRDETCYQVLQDIVIPAGTILRADGQGNFMCLLAGGKFTIGDRDAAISIRYKRVVA